MKKALLAVLSAIKPWVPLLAILAPATGGAGLVINGVHILAGEGWAFISGGLCLIAIAAVIRRGIYHVG